MRRVFVRGGPVQGEGGQESYTSRTTPHVTCVTRHAQNAKPTSRCRTVAPLHHGASRCTMEHHDATGVTTPRQRVKASLHRHKWMLSHGAPADPSDPWNSHARRCYLDAIAPPATLWTSPTRR